MLWICNMWKFPVVAMDLDLGGWEVVSCVPTKLLDHLSSTSTYWASIIIKARPKIVPSHLGSLWGTSTNLQVGLYWVGCYTTLFDRFGSVYGENSNLWWSSGLLIIVMFPLVISISVSSIIGYLYFVLLINMDSSFCTVCWCWKHITRKPKHRLLNFEGYVKGLF